MLRKRINNFDLYQYSIFKNRMLKSSALYVSIFCLLGASACTSSNSSPSLIAKPTIVETLASVKGTDAVVGIQTDIQTDGALSTPELSQIPLPKPAPNIPKHQTSLLAEGKVSTQAPSQVPSQIPLNAEQISSVTKEGQTVANLQNARIISSGASAPNAISSGASAPNASSASAPNANHNTLETASIKRQAPERKLNFFERLLKSRREKQTQKNLNSKKSQLDAEVLRRAKVNGNSQGEDLNKSTHLPGVKLAIKEGVKLLNVQEDINHEDDSSVQVASVGALGRTAGPHGLILQTQGVQVACLKPKLLAVLNKVERRFGKKVMVTSGYRSPARNRRAGGVKNSHHTSCSAADIQVLGISKWNIAKYLRSLNGRGGVGTYCRTNSVHIDIGNQRDWHQPCRRRKRRK